MPESCRKLIEYSGEAISYQVLEESAALGIGAAIMPRSKVSRGQGSSMPISDKRGAAVTIAFEAVWSGDHAQAAHLKDFSRHLRAVVPSIVAGMADAACFS